MFLHLPALRFRATSLSPFGSTRHIRERDTLRPQIRCAPESPKEIPVQLPAPLPAALSTETTVKSSSPSTRASASCPALHKTKATFPAGLPAARRPAFQTSRLCPRRLQAPPAQSRPPRSPSAGASLRSPLFRF